MKVVVPGSGGRVGVRWRLDREREGEGEGQGDRRRERTTH